MLKPNFGINADKKEWANFCKKKETYDRKWWVSLQKNLESTHENTKNISYRGIHNSAT